MFLIFTIHEIMSQLGMFVRGGTAILRIPLVASTLTIFPGTLERVPNESWRPSKEDATHALLRINCAPGLDVGLVNCGVNLSEIWIVVSPHTQIHANDSMTLCPAEWHKSELTCGTSQGQEE